MIHNELGPGTEFFSRFKNNVRLGQESAFKFYHARDKDHFFTKPSILIGTLSRYRQIEKDSLRDATEGVSSLTINGEFSREDLSRNLPVKRAFGIKDAGPSRLIVWDTTVTTTFDCYVYCFSWNSDGDVLKSLNQDSDPFDAVIRIRSISFLANLITNYHPVLKGYKWQCLPILYTKQHRQHTNPSRQPFDETFEKPTSFLENQEGRIAFIPPSGRFPPILPSLTPWPHPWLEAIYERWTLPT